MNADTFKKFKHELRTPVNHILGYSDLLLEIADESNDHSTAALARSLLESGQELATLLERHLTSPGSDIDEGQILAMCDSIRPFVKDILHALPPRRRQSFHDADLEHIRTAACSLLRLIGSDEVAASGT